MAIYWLIPTQCDIPLAMFSKAVYLSLLAWHSIGPLCRGSLLVPLSMTFYWPRLQQQSPLVPVILTFYWSHYCDILLVPFTIMCGFSPFHCDILLVPCGMLHVVHSIILLFTDQDSPQHSYLPEVSVVWRLPTNADALIGAILAVTKSNCLTQTRYSDDIFEWQFA